jgi:hypothetical protein
VFRWIAGTQGDFGEPRRQSVIAASDRPVLGAGAQVAHERLHLLDRVEVLEQRRIADRCGQHLVPLGAERCLHQVPEALVGEEPAAVATVLLDRLPFGGCESHRTRHVCLDPLQQQLDWVHAALVGGEGIRNRRGVGELRGRESPAAQVVEVLPVAPAERDRRELQRADQSGHDRLVLEIAHPAELGDQVGGAGRDHRPDPAAQPVRCLEYRDTRPPVAA